MSLKDYITKVNYELKDICLIIKSLINSVIQIQKINIFHRDIKLGNIVINTITNEIRLIDWGMAEFYHPGQVYSSRVSTLPYKPPELLLEFECYDMSIDTWLIGMVFGCLVRLKAF